MKILLRRRALLLCVALCVSGAYGGDFFFAPGISVTDGWYDVNKAYSPTPPYWLREWNGGTLTSVVDTDRMKEEFPIDDSLHCSAAAASNMIHAWWDKNRGTYESIYGSISGPFKYTGTRDAYSAQNSEIFRWYIGVFMGAGLPFQNKMQQYFSSNCKAYFPSYSSSDPAILGSAYGVNETSLPALTAQVAGLVDRGPVGLTINGHAITCWGYTLTGEGMLESLIVTDSDDRITGLVRLLLAQEKNKDGHFGFTGVETLGNVAHLKTTTYDSMVGLTMEESTDYYGESFYKSENSYLLDFYTMNDLPALPVPEPASSMLLIMGSCLLWRRRRARCF